MVERVTFLIPDVVGPTDEGVELFKIVVEPECLENSAVLELVDSNQTHERSDRTVNEQPDEQ